MPSIMQMLDDLVSETSKHPGAEELLSAIPTVAGAMMLARNGGNTRLGAPIGAGLATLGGLGLFKGSRDEAMLQQNQQQKKMSDALKNAFPTGGPQQSLQQALPSLVEGGWTPSESISLAKEMKPEAGDLWWDTATNSYITVPKDAKPPNTAVAKRPTDTNYDADVSALDKIIANTTDPKRKAELEAFKGPVAREGSVALSRFGKLMPGGESKAAPSWRNTVDSEGRSIQVPYKIDPTTGEMVRVPIRGEGAATGSSEGLLGKPSMQQEKQLNAVSSVEAMVPQMTSAIAALPDASSGELARQYAKYRAPFGALGEVDPRYSEYFNQLGQIQTDLVQAAMGSSRAFQMVEMLKPHIPSPTDPPQRAMEKLKGFEAGRFQALRKAILGEKAAAPASPSALPEVVPPKPKFSVSKTYHKDGMWYVQDPKGKFYRFAEGSWRPL